MNPRTWQRVKQLFSEAVDLPSGERAAFVSRHTLDRPELADEVLKLLALDPDADDPLDRSTMPGELIQSAARRHRHYRGERLASRYEIRKFLAAGGSGEVYEAEDLERGERIAVKSLSHEIPDGDQLAWLRREVGAARRVSHRNVARVYDLVQSGDTVFLTMELLAGETLAARLKRQGAMGRREALPLVRQIVAGLAAAHAAGVVHRDLKPGNVMIVPRPDGPPRVVITDFGLARPAPEDPHTTVRAASQIMGTPAYMAPEQVLGRSITSAADIYALGVVIYEMLTGATPFADESALTMAVRKTQGRPASPAALAPGISAAWTGAILRCLDPDPRKRFRHVSDLLVALEARSVASQRWRLWRRAAMRTIAAWTPARLVAVTVTAAMLAIAWLWWRPEPTPVGAQAWENALQSLLAGEPALAARLLEDAAAQHRLPARAPMDLALAWHRAGFAVRASAALPSRFSRTGDAGYERAVRAQLAGRTTEALDLMRRRSSARPGDAAALADLAAWEPQTSARTWQRVLDLQPNHLAAQLRLADLSAPGQPWAAVERGYLTAQTRAEGNGNVELARRIAGRRGLARLRVAGDPDAARADMLPFFTLPSIAGGAGTCERKITLQEGAADAFALPPDATAPMSSRLQKMMADSGMDLRKFDERRDNRPFGLSFALPPVRVCAAQLVVRLRRGPDSPSASNDGLVIGVAPFDKLKDTMLLWGTFPERTDQVRVWDLRQEFFANLQLAYAGDAVAWVDLYLNDDTDIDYAKLTLVY